MQGELDAAGYAGEIQILGVNGAGYESGNTGFTTDRALPWLQDTAEANVWVSWNVTYRDVWVLDGENEPVAVYNVTEHDLADAANYQALRDILISAAAP